MKISARVKSTDRGYREMLRNVHIKNSRVEVGVFAQAGSETYGKSGATVLDVAVWNEFGTYGKSGEVHIPPRPFIRLYFDTQQARITSMALRACQDIVRKRFTKTQALNRIGLGISTEIQKAVSVGYFGLYPPNAPSTIAKKGSETPLVETDQMRRSISYRVKFR